MTKQTDEISDEVLFKWMVEGRQSAYTVLYERYWPALFIHATRILQDENDAMDVVQDVFTALWLKKKELEIKVSLKAYLYTSVRNQTLNHIQKNKSKDRYISSLADFVQQNSRNEVEEQVILKEFIQIIDKEIKQLPDKTRAIFELSRKQGYSHRMIAKELNIAPDTVKKTINRAIKKIKLRINKLSAWFF